MKNIRFSRIVLIVAFLIGSSGIMAQTRDVETVVISVSEFSVASMNLKSLMIVIDEKGEVHKIPLVSISPKNYEEAVTENAIIIQHEINKWKAKGFKIETSTSDMENGNRYKFIILSK